VWEAFDMCKTKALRSRADWPATPPVKALTGFFRTSKILPLPLYHRPHVAPFCSLERASSGKQGPKPFCMRSQTL
jgi:hypothetical protein